MLLFRYKLYIFSVSRVLSLAVPQELLKPARLCQSCAIMVKIGSIRFLLTKISPRRCTTCVRSETCDPVTYHLNLGPY